MLRGWLSLIVGLLLTLHLSAQTDTARHWLQPAPTFDDGRFGLVTGGISATFGGSLFALNEYWYKDYPRGTWHWKNDWAGWLQMDKAGHIFNGYFFSHWISHMYQWSGMPPKKATLIGGTVGFLMLSSVEWLDGYSTQWGASGYDLLFNALGSGLAIGQELAWQEQRIQLKISAFPQAIPVGLEDRTRQLYGNTIAELVLKDYNALTVWGSANVASFLPNDHWWPSWLNVAVGYGADGMYGAEENRWCSGGDCPPNAWIDRSDIPRLRQYYLSLDVDLSRIPSKKPWVRTLLGMVNLIKVPAPAIMLNSNGQLRFYPIYF